MNDMYVCDYKKKMPPESKKKKKEDIKMCTKKKISSVHKEKDTNNQGINYVN